MLVVSLLTSGCPSRHGFGIYTQGQPRHPQNTYILLINNNNDKNNDKNSSSLTIQTYKCWISGPGISYIILMPPEICKTS